MKPAFEYKGYLGSAEVSLEDNLLVGRLLYIRDVVSYVAGNPVELRAAFESAVDDYLLSCEELGDAPDKPFKGTFNVRTGPERHRCAALAAEKEDTSLNEWVCKAIDALLSSKSKSVTNHVTVHFYGQTNVRQVATTGHVPIWTERLATGTPNPVRH